MFSPVTLIVSLVLLQTAPQNSSAIDALALLSEISQHYAQAKSYHIEAIEERTSGNELHRDWDKTFLTAIVMPGGHYRYEGRSGLGSAVLVSDGASKWVYHVDEHLYTQQSASAPDSEKRRIIPEEELSTEVAKNLVAKIRRLPKRLKSATLLPDETILVNGHSLECYVIRYSDADLKIKNSDLKQTETLWIDKSRKVAVKTVAQLQTYMMIAASRARIPISEETTTIYPVAEFDPQEPASSFSFVPPPDAKLIAAFPTPDLKPAEIEPSELMGKRAPELRLKSSEGSVTTLSSFRGKPVFIEFWAAWCGPCVDLVPGLVKLYSETATRGLVWISIDSDEDASDATAFLSKEHIPWPNYHDEDGSLGKAFQLDGLPLGVLIDADGKISFYRSGYDIADLRNAVAKLGPQFSSTAPAGASSK